MKVNGGAAQSEGLRYRRRDWDTVGQATVTLIGLQRRATRTPSSSSATARNTAPDLDWIEVVAASTTPGAGRCVAGRTVAIRSFANASYASNRPDDSNNVKAQAPTIGSWEQFDVIDIGNGQVALNSHQNGMYMTADISWSTAPIGARAPSVGPWEKFRFEQLADGYYALRAMANSKLVSTRINLANAPLQAVATTASAWEEFQCD